MLVETQREIATEFGSIEGRDFLFNVGKLMGRKWAFSIMDELLSADAYTPQDGLRFNMIRNSLEAISAKVLSQRLRELEAEGLIERTVNTSGAPVSVTYFLTDKGADFEVVLHSLYVWNQKHGKYLSKF